jgi:hypothetical protein
MQSASGSLPVVRGTEPRRLAAFVHADMVGYSRLIEQDVLQHQPWPAPRSGPNGGRVRSSRARWYSGYRFYALGEPPWHATPDHKRLGQRPDSWAAAMLIETNRSNRRDADPYGRINRAADLIAKAELATHNSPDVLAAKFRLLIQQQRYEEAVATFSRLLDIDSSAAGRERALLILKCGERADMVNAALLVKRRHRFSSNHLAA